VCGCASSTKGLTFFPPILLSSFQDCLLQIVSDGKNFFDSALVVGYFHSQ
jgi:hypothetical protein